MSSVLLTGASGFVGSHVLPALLDAGHQVRALVRGDAAETLVLARLGADRRDAVSFSRGDVTGAEAPKQLAAAMAGTDTVVHLVAIPRDLTGGRDLLRVNLDGTRAVIEAMRVAGVRRLVHLGALGVADDPALHYGTSKARAEVAVAESGLDFTILKPSLLWGERDGFFNIVADLVRISPGLVPVPGRGTSRFQPLWIGDLARVVALCLERPETAGRSCELGGPRVWTYREITAEVLRGMGSRRAIVPVPVPLIALVGGVCEAVHLPFPVASDQLRQLRLDNVGPVDGVERSFGFAPRDMAGNLGYLRRRKGDQEPGGIVAA
jgi:nucleoside-diphosphate-sugar epimerase